MRAKAFSLIHILIIQVDPTTGHLFPGAHKTCEGQVLQKIWVGLLMFFQGLMVVKTLNFFEPISSSLTKVNNIYFQK
jgi:hypothetical protein